METAQAAVQEPASYSAIMLSLVCTHWFTTLSLPFGLQPLSLSFARMHKLLTSLTPSLYFPLLVTRSNSTDTELTAAGTNTHYCCLLLLPEEMGRNLNSSSTSSQPFLLAHLFLRLSLSTPLTMSTPTPFLPTQVCSEVFHFSMQHLRGVLWSRLTECSPSQFDIIHNLA